MAVSCCTKADGKLRALGCNILRAVSLLILEQTIANCTYTLPKLDIGTDTKFYFVNYKKHYTTIHDILQEF